MSPAAALSGTNTLAVRFFWFSPAKAFIRNAASRAPHQKGDVVQIAPDVEHWHGACAKRPMTHISIETNVPNNKAIWLEAVTEGDYAEANKA